MITVAVPPALVACLAIAVASATARLWARGVSVSSSGHVTLAGLVDTVAFDKTGTLTEIGLELRELRLAAGGAFAERAVARAELVGGGGASDAAPAPAAGLAGALGGAQETGGGGGGGSGEGAVPRHVRALLACCHGLAMVDGQLAGDPLELRLFEASGWRCLGEGEEGKEGGGGEEEAASGGGGGGGEGGMVFESADGLERCRVVSRLDFTSARQRSSVVVADADGALTLFTKVGSHGSCPISLPTRKPPAPLHLPPPLNHPQPPPQGSPEAVRDLCAPRLLPPDFDAQLPAATRAGLRAIALAHRALPAGAARAAFDLSGPGGAALEAGLEFDGFALLVNPLKPDSAGVIAQLRGANLQVRMCASCGENSRAVTWLSSISSLIN
jgi:cation-transporting ATPase 13A2